MTTETAPKEVASQTPSMVLIKRLARAAHRLFEAGLAPAGLRERHVIALSYLRDHGATPQQTLARALRIDPSNLVGLLNELEEKGLVVRRHAPGDRRRHIVEVTPVGDRTVTEDLRRSIEAVEDQLLSALSPEERDTLHDLLSRATAGTTPCEDKRGAEDISFGC